METYSAVRSQPQPVAAPSARPEVDVDGDGIGLHGFGDSVTGRSSVGRIASKTRMPQMDIVTVGFVHGQRRTGR